METWKEVALLLTVVTLTLTVLGTCWRVIRLVNRIYDVLKDYPPHRHLGRRIAYPKDFEPAEQDEMADRRGAGSSN